MDSERHFAADCISRLSGSSPETLKCSILMNSPELWVRDRRGILFGGDLFKNLGMGSVLDLFGEGSDACTLCTMYTLCTLQRLFICTPMYLLVYDL